MKECTGMYVIFYYFNFTAVKITRSLGNFFGFFERNLLLTLRFLESCACAFSVISVIFFQKMHGFLERTESITNLQENGNDISTLSVKILFRYPRKLQL